MTKKDRQTQKKDEKQIPIVIEEKFKRNDHVNIISGFYKGEIGIVENRKIISKGGTVIILYKVIIDNIHTIECLEEELKLLNIK